MSRNATSVDQAPEKKSAEGRIQTENRNTQTLPRLQANARTHMKEREREKGLVIKGVGTELVVDMLSCAGRGYRRNASTNTTCGHK